MVLYYFYPPPPHPPTHLWTLFLTWPNPTHCSSIILWTPLIYRRGWDFWKIVEGGVQVFIVKMGGSPCRGRGGSYRREEGEGKHCFSLIMCGFCSSNALYSERLSFRVFIFLLTPFDTWNSYYFRLNLSLVFLIRVLFTIKHVTLFSSLLKMKK